MTYAELKAEARKQGYNLIKIKRREKLLPCTCGCNKRKHIFEYDRDSGRHYILLECYKCGLRGPQGINEDDAIRNWNEMIRKKLNSTDS